MSEKLAEGELESVLKQVDWEKGGGETVPVVVQEEDGEVLTLAYMNKEALRLTLEEGTAHYYSRSKGRIRMKGEVSGNVQRVKEVKLDCDEDALLIRVDQSGPACHTGERSCFYRRLGEPKSTGGLDYSLNILKELQKVIADRQEDPQKGSYTSSLFAAGEEEIAKKFGEEAIEVVVADGEKRVKEEVADLLYHLLVLLRQRGVELGQVMEELRGRRKNKGSG